MPTVPKLPPEMLGGPNTGGAMPTDPSNFLLAAADLHQSGNLSAPVPTGHPLQTGKKPSRRGNMQVVK